ncbi:MAG: type II toxin-antitoxin system RelE/ParE family toxin [Firmicutes bacterium]|nr:type II toxin-antitoxin system RelE/ParE family toxin [Bacillota bacterium]
MTWKTEFLPEAIKDLKHLDRSNQILACKAIQKVSKNLLPDYEGGYGHPLSNKCGLNLSSFLKIKLRASEIRIVYKLERRADNLLIIVIGARADDEAYESAAKRIQRHNL